MDQKVKQQRFLKYLWILHIPKKLILGHLLRPGSGSATLLHAVCLNVYENDNSFLTSLLFLNFSISGRAFYSGGLPQLIARWSTTADSSRKCGEQLVTRQLAQFPGFKSS
jgi:hypothetical protein